MARHQESTCRRRTDGSSRLRNRPWGYTVRRPSRTEDMPTSGAQTPDGTPICSLCKKCRETRTGERTETCSGEPGSTASPLLTACTHAHTHTCAHACAAHPDVHTPMLGKGNTYGTLDGIKKALLILRRIIWLFLKVFSFRNTN